MWAYYVSFKGDSIACDITVGDGCTTVLTTQASTKVKSLCSLII